MSTLKFMMVTVAACDPSFVQQALQHVGKLASELREKAGAQTTRYGVLATGSDAGSLVLFQTYDKLAGIDKAFQVYGDSANYKALMTGDKLKVTLRNVVKLEALQVSKPAPEKLAYGVVTRWKSADLMLDKMKELVPIFEKNGAAVLRYGTLMTGNHAGNRLLAAGYLSMDAIEQTYEGLAASDVYRAAMGQIDINMRNIVRLMG